MSKKSEAVEAGVTRTEKKQNPLDIAGKEDVKKQKKKGNWIKATKEEIAKYEKEGRLLGYDKIDEEVFVLLKGEKQ